MEYKKCEKDLSYLCKTLASKVSQGYNKGLNLLTVYNCAHARPTKSLVVYKETIEDNGLIVNYCPWCGVKFNLNIGE